MKNCLIVDFHSKHIDDIKHMVASNFDVVEVVDAFKYRFNGTANYIILSGGAHIPDLYYEKDFYKRWLEYIQNSTIPILGICFGCELIAVAYGCTIIDTGHKNIFDQEICLGDTKYCIRAHEAHRFNISRVSDVIEIIAHGNNDSIEIIRHKVKPHVGVQFHPEVSLESERMFGEIIKLTKV